MNNRDNKGRFVKGQTPYNKSGRIEQCKVCKKEIWLEKKQEGRKKFCSKKCFYIGRELKGTFKKGHKDLVPKSKRGHSFETRIKIGKGGIGKHCGSLSGRWKGGISKIDKLCRLMIEYKQWRSDIFTRDNWTCMTCGKNGIYITAHHIYSFSKIIREENIKSILEARKCSRLWDINNGVTLCEDCHKLTDNYKGRGKKRG